MLQSRGLGLTVLLDVWRFFPRGQSIRKLAYKPDKYKPELNKKPKKEKKPLTYEVHTNSQVNTRNTYLQKYHVPQDGVSATQTWVKILGSKHPVVPRYLFVKEFPSGFHPPDLSPTGRRPKRTPDDKKRVECVMKVYIPTLEQYVTPEMIQSIKRAPYYKPDDNEIVFKSHQHLTQVKNGRQCEKNCSNFLRNVASEILYREKENAADDSVGREVDGEGEGKQRSPPVVVSEAETRSMAYSWKKTFKAQMRQYQNKINRERSKNSSSIEEEDDN